jgi:hypothetical protein
MLTMHLYDAIYKPTIHMNDKIQITVEEVKVGKDMDTVQIIVEEVKVGKDMDTVHIIVEEVKVAVQIGMSGE